MCTLLFNVNTQPGNTNAPTIMIAEKTADAIKGRKLTPFEPPVRVPTGLSLYPPSQAAALHTSPSNSIYYKAPTRQPPPPPRPQLVYPPPMDQIYPEYLERSLIELANATSGQSPLRKTIADATGQDYRHHYDFMLKRYGSSMMVNNLLKQIASSGVR